MAVIRVGVAMGGAACAGAAVGAGVADGGAGAAPGGGGGALRVSMRVLLPKVQMRRTRADLTEALLWTRAVGACAKMPSSVFKAAAGQVRGLSRNGANRGCTHRPFSGSTTDPQRAQRVQRKQEINLPLGTGKNRSL